jgi:hypothetical protein
LLVLFNVIQIIVLATEFPRQATFNQINYFVVSVVVILVSLLATVFFLKDGWKRLTLGFLRTNTSFCAQLFGFSCSRQFLANFVWSSPNPVVGELHHRGAKQGAK